MDSSEPPRVVREQVAGAHTDPTSEKLLQGALLEFTRRGWSSGPDTYSVVKIHLRGGPPKAEAFFIAVFVNWFFRDASLELMALAGIVALFGLVVLGRRYRFTLRAEKNGQVSVRHPRGVDYISRPDQVIPLAEGLKPGIDYREALGVGLLAVLFSMILFHYYPTLSLIGLLLVFFVLTVVVALGKILDL